MEEKIISNITLSKWVALHRLGLLPEEEEQRLSRWLAADSERQRLFDSLLKEEIVITSGGISAEETWADFLKKYPILRKKRTIMPTMVAIACSIALIVSIGVWWSLERKAVDPLHIQEKIRLVLEDGSIFSPDSATMTLSAQQKKYTVNMTEEGMDYSLGQTEEPLGQTTYHTVVVPPHRVYTIRLSDNTLVQLNSGTTLRYPVYLSQESREVWLDGEALFEVTQNNEKPFIVHTEGTTITVLGTIFNVNAYKAEELVKTTLMSGSVKVDNGTHSMVIEPGEQAVTKPGDLTIQVEKADMQSVTAWTRDMFYFNEIPLEEIMEGLARWYAVEVVFKNEALKERRFSVEVSRHATFEKMIEILEETQLITLRKEGNKVYIH